MIVTALIKQWAKDNNQELHLEHTFHPTRKWRFDYAFPKLMVAVEYEGLFAASKKSRHTTIKGFTEDAEKYNEAAILGWRVLRITAVDYHKVIDLLTRILESTKG